MDGYLLYNKVCGITSFEALNPVKKALSSGKCGHTGTLDKFASGLLIVLAGRALKLSRYFLHSDKKYSAEVEFGSETDTLDTEGQVIATAHPPSLAALEDALRKFKGGIAQVPPEYSALHIEGKRSYQLVRGGQKVELKPRAVEIYSLELAGFDGKTAKLNVHCSGGTYIRALARDIALEAASRAHLKNLLRTQIAGFSLDDALFSNEYEKIRAGFRGITEELFQKLKIPALQIKKNTALALKQGKALRNFINEIFDGAETETEKPYSLFCNDIDSLFIAIISKDLNGKWRYEVTNF